MRRDLNEHSRPHDSRIDSWDGDPFPPPERSLVLSGVVREEEWEDGRERCNYGEDGTESLSFVWEEER